MNHPPYNPNQPGAPYPPQTGNVGFEQYQQGAPPPAYNAAPAPYPQQQYPQQQYPQQQHGGPPAPYGHGSCGSGPCGPSGPYGTAAHPPGGQHPQTVYVYEDRHKKKKQSDEDTCLAMLAGACAMCLCCSLLSD